MTVVWAPRRSHASTAQQPAQPPSALPSARPRSLFLPRPALVLVIVVLVALGGSKIAQPADAYKISFNNERAMGYYRHEGYRQYPHWIVGVFGPHSGPAIGSGNAKVHPTVSIDLRVINAPNEFFQFVVYHAKEIEGRIVAGIPGAHPCMFRGQAAGVAVFENMTEYLFEDKASGHGMEVEHEGHRRRMFAISNSFALSYTGLYVMTINSCRFLDTDSATGNRSSSEVAEGGGSERTDRAPTLLVSGWHEAVVSGHFQVRNPYGFLPGELYGMLPGFAVLAAVMWAALLTYAVMLLYMTRQLRSGVSGLLVYHKILLAVLALSALSYAILLGYYNRYNTTDQNVRATFVAGVVALKLRDGVALVGLFMLCYGVGVTQRRLPWHFKVGLGISVTVHIVCSLAAYRFDDAIHFDTLRTGGVADSAEQPTIGRAAANICVLLVTGGLLLVSAYYLLLHCRRLNPAIVNQSAEHARATGGEVFPIPTDVELRVRRVKYRMFTRTAVLFVVVVIVSGVWMYVQANLFSVAEGVAAETPENWKAWWAPTVVLQLIVTLTILCMACVWPPLKSSRQLRFMFDPTGVGFEDPRYRDGDQFRRVYAVAERRAGPPCSPSGNTATSSSSRRYAARSRHVVTYSDEEEEAADANRDPPARAAVGGGCDTHRRWHATEMREIVEPAQPEIEARHRRQREEEEAMEEAEEGGQGAISHVATAIGGPRSHV